MNKTKKKGFTLIELLVVIAIIGLLATLSVVALNNARARARDARRVSDIKQIQTALGLYFDAANEYPSSATSTIAFGDVTFMDPVPTAPTPADCETGNAYVYTSASPYSTYTLTYCLGNDTGGIKGGVLQTATPEASFSVAAE